jgi:hypothetical protein
MPQPGTGTRTVMAMEIQAKKCARVRYQAGLWTIGVIVTTTHPTFIPPRERWPGMVSTRIVTVETFIF